MKITNEQKQMLKDNIDKMAESDEQFFFMLYKNENGTDNVTGHAHNMSEQKLLYYLKKESDRRIRTHGT